MYDYVILQVTIIDFFQYVRESDRYDRDTDRTSSEFDDRLLDSSEYTSAGPSPGMFGGTCEFCGNIARFFFFNHPFSRSVIILLY